MRCALVAVLLLIQSPASAAPPSRAFLARARVIDLTYLRHGVPFTPQERQVLAQGADQDEIERVLDARCLFHVHINPESRVKVALGPAAPELREGGWRTFLVRVENEAGVTAKLEIESPSASPRTSSARRWLALEVDPPPVSTPGLSGERLEYRVLSLYSAAGGKREAKFSFNVGQGTQDLGFRSEADVLFRCRPAPGLTLRVRTPEGKPAQVRLGIRDLAGRELPPQTLRPLEERAQALSLVRDSQVLKLAAGEYRFRWIDLAGRTQVRPVVVDAKGGELEIILAGR